MLIYAREPQLDLMGFTALQPMRTSLREALAQFITHLQTVIGLICTFSHDQCPV